MDKNQLETYKHTLMREKSKILQAIKDINENDLGGSLKEFCSELSSYDNHPADMGTETYMMEQSMNLKNNEINMLDNIDNALKSIEDGTYGKCSVCGKEISTQRLDFIPYANTCTVCMDKEPVAKKDYRPIEEDVLGYPFSRTQSMITNNIEVDVEDVYQDIQEHNRMVLDPDAIGIYDDFKSGVLEGTQKIEKDTDLF